MLCYTKVALVLVLSFCTLTAHADHHSHDSNHQDDHAHKDVLASFDHFYHEHHHHHPVDHPNCGQVCPKSLPKFQQFEVGQVYTVEVDGQTVINVKDGQTVGLSGKIDVQVNSPCEFQLRLRDSRVEGVPNGQQLGQQLDSSPVLRFGAHDGKILGVCPTPEESAWTLNVKKSLLSAMQLTTKDLSQTQTVEEVDFSGHCTTTYRPLTDGSVDTKNVLLEKTKNLNKCHLRRKNIAGFNTKSLSLLTEFLRENLPLLKSTQRCIQEIKNGHLFSVTCTELQTLSFQDDPIVKSTLNLRFGGKAPAAGAVAPDVPNSAQSLLMTRDKEDERVAQESDVTALLRTMCSQVSGPHLTPEVTESFHSLVVALRTLPEAGTKLMDKATKSGTICQSPKLRNLFLGASAFAASDPSIQTVIGAHKDKEITDTQLLLLLGPIALKAKPSEITIDLMVALIEPKESPRPLTLAVSLMVRNFCKKSDTCDANPAVKKTIDALLKKLRESDCNLVAITTIKALDNIKAKSDPTVKSALLDVAQASDKDAGVRIAAIQALQRIADDEIRNKLIDILLKASEPNEVRLTAYRSAVLSGASAEQLESIRSVTDSQIQNFIRTHIQDLKKSSNPNRRNLLPQNAPEFEEPRSRGLFVTRHVEFSYKGMTFEESIIHPKDSHAISFFSGEVWVPVGDKNYQLLEIQIRQQGLDKHINKIFSRGFSGPEILGKVAEELQELMEHLRNPSHGHPIILQLSVRLSGRNIIFIDTFEDLHTLAVLAKDGLRELYETEVVDSARALSLLDNVVEVPTINGFPMVLHLNETLVLGMKADMTRSEAGGVRLRKGRSSRTYLDELSAGLVLKVAQYRPGFDYHIRSEITPSSDVEAERIPGKMLKMKINLPNERKTLVKLHRGIRMIDANGQKRESNEISDARSGDETTRCRELFGLNFCETRSSVDNYGVTDEEIYITKSDPSVQSIEMTLEKTPHRNPGDPFTASARINAGQREYLAQFDMTAPQAGTRKAMIKLQSPKRTITTEAQYFRSADGNMTKLEWDLKLPHVIDVNAKYNVENVGEQNNVDVLVEYQKAGGNKENIKWIRKSSLDYKKNKKTKQITVSYAGELQSTEFPKYNTKVSYYTSLRPYQNSKTEFSAEWGPGLKDKVKIAHTSKMDILELRPFQMVSENALVIEATPLDINYDLKLDSDISMLKSSPKTVNLNLVGKDVNGRPDREIKGSFKYERQDSPIQQVINASLHYPGRDLTYYSEVKQIKDLTFAGKTILSKERGKTMTVEHKTSMTNPTKDFHMATDAEVSYSWKPDKYTVSQRIGYAPGSPNKMEYKHTYALNGQKYNEWELLYDKSTGTLNGQTNCHGYQTEFKVDNIHNARSAQWSLRQGEKAYKFSAIRVPKESYTLKLDSSENSRLKELKVKVSRKEKSTFKMATNDGSTIDAYVDVIPKDVKRGHLEFNFQPLKLSHSGDITANIAQRKLVWNSKTNKDNKPYLTLESQFSPKERTFIILKKIKSPDNVSKFEYFYDKGVYAATLDTSRYTAVLEGENRNQKKFGKLGFVDKVDNYEHKSHFNISNGILTVKSISDKEKQTFTKLDAVVGYRIISNVSLITPKINSQLMINPLGEKKILVLNYVSPSYDQNTNVEWVPRKYLKVDSLSQRKVDPVKRIKFDAYLTRHDEAKVLLTAPALDIDIRRVKTPKPHYIFNTTINGYNEVQEFETNPSLSPEANMFVALRKFLESYTSGN